LINLMTDVGRLMMQSGNEGDPAQTGARLKRSRQRAGDRAGEANALCVDLWSAKRGGLLVEMVAVRESSVQRGECQAEEEGRESEMWLCEGFGTARC